MPTYRFSQTKIHDLKCRHLVTIDGRRDVILQNQGTVTLALIYPPPVASTFVIPEDFDLCSYQTGLAASPMAYPEPEFVVLYGSLQTSGARRHDVADDPAHSEHHCFS